MCINSDNEFVILGNKIIFVDWPQTPTMTCVCFSCVMLNCLSQIMIFYFHFGIENIDIDSL